MVNFLKRFLITLFMAVSWLILALFIHLSPASGADSSIADKPHTGVSSSGYGTGTTEPDGTCQSEKYPDFRDITIDIARTAFESRDFESGIMAFERAMENHPDISFEDCDSMYSSPESLSQETTPQYFLRALPQNPQEDVQSNINKYFHAIRTSKKEHFLSAKISLGLDLDDKADPSALADTGICRTACLNDGVTVTVDRPEKGQKHTSTASIDYLYRPKGSTVSWKLSGMNYVAAYREDRDLDVNLYDFKAGASIETEKLTWDVYGTTNHVSRDSGQYLRTYGAGMAVNYAFASCFRLSVDGKFKAKNYFEDSDRDASNVSLAVSPIVTLGRSRFSLSVGLEHEDARNEINAYTKINGNATYELVLPFASSAYVSYWYQGTDYKDAGSGRLDEVHYVSTGFTKSIPVWKSIPRNLEMDLNLNYTYTRSDSNIDLYAYTKNVLSSGMSVVF